MKQALAGVHWWPSPTQSHRELSGGQKQKLAIAAALTMEPQLLILDEPTSNLNPAATATVMEQIRSLRAQGQTMLLIEHKLEYLEDVVDRVILLSADGCIEAVGTPDQVLRQYGNWLIEQGIMVSHGRQPYSRQANCVQGSTTEASRTRISPHQPFNWTVGPSAMEKRSCWKT